METQPKVRTRGLNHVNLVVADVGTSRRFYEDGLGFELDSEANGITFLSTPGAGDVLALQAAGGELDLLSGRQRTPGEMGAIDHIGFAVDPADLDRLVAAGEAAGGQVLMRLTTGAGAPVVFMHDPDGYVLQLG